MNYEHSDGVPIMKCSLLQYRGGAVPDIRYLGSARSSLRPT